MVSRSPSKRLATVGTFTSSSDDDEDDEETHFFDFRLLILSY
jgi:hypothetical protein